MLDEEKSNELREAAIALVKVRKDPSNEKQHSQAKLRLVKAKQAMKIPKDCYTDEEIQIAKSLPGYIEPVGRFGEPKKVKKAKKKEMV